MPVVSVNRDKLFQALGRTYSCVPRPSRGQRAPGRGHRLTRAPAPQLTRSSRSCASSMASSSMMWWVIGARPPCARACGLRGPWELWGCRRALFWGAAADGGAPGGRQARPSPASRAAQRPPPRRSPGARAARLTARRARRAAAPAQTSEKEIIRKEHNNKESSAGAAEASDEIIYKIDIPANRCACPSAA
jgi:hypothetical protein